MKIKLQIKNRWYGSVIFEYEKEDNTIYKTLLEAIKSGADLSGADLSGADLRSADLRSADLRSADLSGADLRSANLRSADLRSADLRSAINSEYAIAITRVCAEGDVIGWKKCCDGVIVKLLIPADAKRSNAFGRKCRAEYAKVLEITGPRGGAHTEARSSHDVGFVYRVGETVRPTIKFDENFYDECSTGIHFFITKLEAETY